MRKLLIIFLIIIYLSVGIIYGNWMIYASYYQKSWAAILLNPISPISVGSPFDSDAPAESELLKEKYGSYEKYKSSLQATEGRFLCTIGWPLVMFVGYGVSLITWLIWAAVKFYYLMAAITAALSP